LSHEHLGLFDTPPDRRQVRFSLAIAGLLFVATLPVLLVRDVRLPEAEGFIPTIDAIMFVGEVITAALLYAQASVFRLRALAVLGTCYLFTGLLLIPHVLTFPGAFSRYGLLGAGINTTAWLVMIRKPAFAIATILYVLFKPADSKAQPEAERPAPRIGLQIFAAIVLATAVAMLTTSSLHVLPPLFLDRTHVIRSSLFGYEGVAIALWIIAIVMLWRRKSSVLDMWLLVALTGWLLQSLLNLTLSGRFTAGFYWLFVMMLFSHLIVMLALIAESARLYARLALSMSAWNREREARLISIDALAAAISHEVGQPLTAVGYHANTGLKWLTGERPDVDRGVRSIRAAIEAGNLATAVIRSIRATFARRTGERSQVGLADLARATVPLLQRELDSAGVLLDLAVDEALPPVLADRVQLQMVLINLLTNAIEALGAVGDRPRRITIRSAPPGSQGVVLEVSDNGVGIAREDMARIFDPFFTTKTTGAGLGLSLCRTIVEAHGGRLWVSPCEDHGATFHLQLPSSGSVALAPNRAVDPVVQL
jgi:signal transduction histidine kinase